MDLYFIQMSNFILQSADEKNSELYKRYKELVDQEQKVVFGGRLGEYKYYDMDKTIEVALEKSRELLP